jgi:hypothetical protein
MACIGVGASRPYHEGFMRGPGRVLERGAGRALLVVVVAAGLVGSVLAGAASAQGAAPSHRAPAGRVRQVSNPAAGRYIVTLKGSAKNDPDASSQQLTREHGGQVTHVYHRVLQGYSAKMSAAQAAALAQDPNVAVVQQDGIVHATGSESPAPTGLDRINQRNLPLDNIYTWGADGHNVHAYVIDTGIQTTHMDFGGRATFGVDEVGDGFPNGQDCNGHGTHVSGILGGHTYGVAKMVNLVEVRVLDCLGNGFDSGVIAGVDWVTMNAALPAVANMSLGGTQGQPDPTMDSAIQASIAAGIEYAIAAGNDNGADACNASPSDVGFNPLSGNVPAGRNALVAGATDPATDTRASFSNIGSCVKLFAPGVNITSDWNGSSNDGCTMGQLTCILSGTSMATPHEAGTAALYLDEHTTATSAQVATAVLSQATPNVVSNPGAGSPNLLDYTGPGSPVLTSTNGNNFVHLSWTAPSSDGGSPLTGFNIYRGTTNGGELPTPIMMVPPSTTTFNDTTAVNGTTYYYQVGAVNPVAATRSNEQFSTPQPAFMPGSYFTVAPTRILDTRFGTGGLSRFGPGQSQDISVASACSSVVPTPSNLQAVVMNVTVTNPDSFGYLTLGPAGNSIPLASNLNFSAGETVPNLVTVPVGFGITFGQKVSIFNAVGNTDLVADVEGCYDDGSLTANNPGLFHAISPTRILDTRFGTGLSGRFGPGQTRPFTVAPSGPLPPNGVASDAQAVILNVTVTNPSAASWLTVFPATGGVCGAPPTASNLNFSAGETVPNLVMVKVGTNGQICIFNNAGSTDVVADAVGYFDTTMGTKFTPLAPARILDTRFGTGLVGQFGPGQTRNLAVAGNGGVPSSGAVAVVMNTTVTGPSAASWLTLFPANGGSVPTASNLNFSAGETVPNLVTVELSTPPSVAGAVSIFNNAGNVNVVADVEGYFS